MAPKRDYIRGEDNTLTWNGVNRKLTGRILIESGSGFIVDTGEGKCVFVSKYVPRFNPNNNK